jgi:hypothetical protein
LKFHGLADARFVLILLACSFVLALACKDGGGSQADKISTPGSTQALQSTPPSDRTPIRGAVGSFDDAHDFLQFVASLEKAIGGKDVKFLLSNTAFTDCSSSQCQAAGPAPQGQVLPVSAYQSEVLYLSRTDYERFLLEFMMNTGSAPDSVGGVEPKLYAYVTPKRESIFEQLRNVEVVEALVTRVSGPLPSDPQVPGPPNARQTLSFGATFRDGKWSIVFIRLLPNALFLDPARSEVASIYDFWQAWGP